MGQFTRREFIKGAGGFVSAAALSSALPGLLEAQEKQRFNILFLMTDQHHHNVLGCAGNPIVKTPNLDRLASEGARFTNATCATPFCSPTRASLITGLWPHTHGIVKNVEDLKLGLYDDAQTAEGVLFDKNYMTAQMGKWHLGDQKRLRYYHDTVDRLATDQYKAFAKGISREKWHKAGKGDVVEGDVCFKSHMVPFHEVWKNEKNRSGQDLSTVGRSLCPSQYQYESWLADQCVDMIHENRDRNFMLTYSVSPPHALWTVPDPYYSMYDPKDMILPPSWNDHPAVYQESQPARLGAGFGEPGVREMLRCYYGQVSMMDWCFGRILKALDDQDLTDDTLVVFLSDHGDMQGGHHMVDKALPAFYEEIVRVPMMVRYPKSIKPGSVITTHAQSVDVMPTLLDFAGQAIPRGVQGTSLRPLLEGRAKDDDRPAFCERGLDKASSRMIRTRRWKYTAFGTQRRELFDLQEDPGEVHNLSLDPACTRIIAGLHERLRLHMERTADPALAVIPTA